MPWPTRNPCRLTPPLLTGLFPPPGITQSQVLQRQVFWVPCRWTVASSCILSISNVALSLSRFNCPLYRHKDWSREEESPSQGAQVLPLQLSPPCMVLTFCSLANSPKYLSSPSVPHRYPFSVLSVAHTPEPPQLSLPGLQDLHLLPLSAELGSHIYFFVLLADEGASSLGLSLLSPFSSEPLVPTSLCLLCALPRLVCCLQLLIDSGFAEDRGVAELLWSSRLGVPCEILGFVADSHRHAPNKYLSSSALQRPCWELLEREG